MNFPASLNLSALIFFGLYITYTVAIIVLAIKIKNIPAFVVISQIVSVVSFVIISFAAWFDATINRQDPGILYLVLWLVTFLYMIILTGIVTTVKAGSFIIGQVIFGKGEDSKKQKASISLALLLSILTPLINSSLIRTNLIQTDISSIPPTWIISLVLFLVAILIIAITKKFSAAELKKIALQTFLWLIVFNAIFALIIPTLFFRDQLAR